jgi:CrcB protein
MMQFLLVAAGGALGAVTRYGLGLTVGRFAPGAAWPWATFAANVTGGLLMGLLAGWLALKAGAGQESIRLFAAVGVLGGFTTFSAFSLEAALMIERRELATAFVYVAGSVVLAIAALFVGLMIARKLFTGVGA